MKAGHWIKLSTPPKDSARVKILQAFRNLEACSFFPLTLKLIMPPKPLICFLATSWYLFVLRPGQMTESTAGCFSRKWARWYAVLVLWTILSSRVLIPLRAMQQSKTLGLAPRVQAAKCTFFLYSQSLKTRAPMMTSECPLIYLEMLWQATSAPSRRGELMQGEQKVLSAMILISGSTALTSLQMTSMSITLRVGLVGLSIQTILVFFFKALTTL